jgi:CheY-like chemotaxis protein
MKPVAVGDGVAAMDALWHGTSRGQPFPLVLLDARMPDVDGLALAAQIRQRAELSATRLILLTSGDRSGDLTRFREQRVNAHLLKPVQQEELLETIYQVMSRQVNGEEVSGGGVSDERSGRTADSLPLTSHDSPLISALRILVAEDNEFNAQLLEQLLARRGHSVQLANNGRDALSLATEEAFDLLLLDVHMPELDGFQVVQAVRERERIAGGHLPIIALTARSRNEDRVRCLEAGMDDFLTKPIQAANLWAAIDRIVNATTGSTEKEGSKIEDHRSKNEKDSRIEPPSSILDPRTLLATCGGDAIILEKICQAFRAYLPDHLSAVQDALQKRDAPRLREAAHRLCGMVAAFSAGAAQVASELEDRAAQGLLDEARPLVGRLEPMVQELLQVVVGLSLDALREATAVSPGSNSLP